MKKLMLPALLFLSWSVYGQIHPLPLQWKFKEGDLPGFADPSLKEQDWKTISLNQTGHVLDITASHSYAWYRVHFDLSPAEMGNDLVLLLGAIDDADETFINGKLVGKTGKFPPGDESAWDLERTYTVKKEWLKRSNTLAIRVYNGGALGGLNAGSGSYAPLLSYISLNDFSALRNKIIEDKHSYFHLTTSNGLISAVYNTRENLIEAAWPHIFNAYDSGNFVEPFIKNIRLNTKENPQSVIYLSNTHIIQAKYKNYTVDYFTSFTRSEKLFFIRLKGRAADIRDLAFYYQKTRGEIVYKETMLKQGQERYFVFGFIDSLHDLRSQVERSIQYISGGQLVQEEESFMKDLFSHCHVPANITQKQRAILEQSISILKMSQVGEKEIFPNAPGQILA